MPGSMTCVSRFVLRGRSRDAERSMPRGITEKTTYFSARWHPRNHVRAGRVHHASADHTPSGLIEVPAQLLVL
jgi:hypothetical protein